MITITIDEKKIIETTSISKAIMTLRSTENTSWDVLELWNEAKERNYFIPAVKAIRLKYNLGLKEAKEIVDNYSKFGTNQPREINWELLEQDHFIYDKYYLVTITKTIDDVSNIQKTAMQLKGSDVLEEVRKWLEDDYSHLDLVEQDKTWLAYEGQDFYSMLISIELFHEITKEQYDMCKELGVA